MAIKIEEINIQNFGPIRKLEFKPALITCIYGLNESGKTFLVEFIIKSLFRDTSHWKDLRGEDGVGKIIISGFDSKPLEFSPTWKERRGSKMMKLDDLINQNNLPLALPLIKLLIVKAGEINIGDNVLSKQLLLELFSHKRIFDLIAERIPKTIKTAIINDGIISINKQGEGKDYYNLKAEIEKINKLIEKVIREYNPGKIEEIKNEIEKNKADKESLLKAKRYKAYTIAKEISKLKAKLKWLPEKEDIEAIKKQLFDCDSKYKEIKKTEEKINSLTKEIEELKRFEDEYEKQNLAKKYLAYFKSEEINNCKIKLNALSEEVLRRLEKNIALYDNKKSEYENKINEEKVLKEKIKELSWIEAAYKEYSKLLEKVPSRLVKNIWFWISLIFILLGTLHFPFSFVFTILGITSIFYYFYRFSPKEKEMEKIKEEFKNKYGSPLVGIHSLSEKKDEVSQFKTKLEILGLDNLKLELDSLKNTINVDFGLLGITSITEEEWKKKFEELKRYRESIRQEIGKLEKELAQLDVDEKDYEKENPGVEFDENLLETLEEKMRDLQGKKEALEETKKLRDDLCREVDDLETEIKSWFKNINEEINEGEDLKEKLNEIEKIREDIKDKEKELEGLEIEESEYITESPGVEYTKKKLEEVEKRIQDLEKEKNAIENNLQSLKGEICNLTEEDITVEWSILIDKLYGLKRQKEEEYKKIVAKIVSGILANQILNELKTQEENFLLEYLNSEEIKLTLKNITQKYKEFKIVGEEILISDGYTDYNIKDLSTGAKEQVLIGIRIGIIKKLFLDKPAFLILDDAFQHVDWRKRPFLIDSLFEISKENWQVIYLTMDDNIKELFEEKFKQIHTDVLLYTLETQK